MILNTDTSTHELMFKIENLKSRNNESFLIAENSRSTAAQLARTEETAAEEKIRQLSTSLEQLKKELSHERNESFKKSSSDAEKNRDLQSQVKILQQKLDSKLYDQNSNKESLEKEIRKLKNDKLKFKIRERRYDLIYVYELILSHGVRCSNKK